MFDIDFVVTWVDGSDEGWIKEYNKYVKPDKRIDVSAIRYRDNGLLKYWFRCIEQNAPWVRKIHFITNGQLPDWINIDCEKLHFVKHVDYIDEKYLPVFNSHPIENCMHKIDGLAEHFVYFNDDFFLINKVFPTDFFNSSGIVKDTLSLYNLPISKFGLILLNNEIAIRERKSIDESFKENKSKWFSLKYGLYNFLTILLYRWKNSSCIHWSHFAQAYTKSNIEECWSIFESELNQTMNSKFRSDTDVNHYLFRNWNLIKGNFEPVNVFKDNCYMNINQEVNKICENILSQRYKQLVINDQEVSDVDDRYAKICEAFKTKFPNKSIFEK